FIHDQLPTEQHKGIGQRPARGKPYPAGGCQVDPVWEPFSYWHRVHVRNGPDPILRLSVWQAGPWGFRGCNRRRWVGPRWGRRRFGRRWYNDYRRALAADKCEHRGKHGEDEAGGAMDALVHGWFLGLLEQSNVTFALEQDFRPSSTERPQQVACS